MKTTLRWILPAFILAAPLTRLANAIEIDRIDKIATVEYIRTESGLKYRVLRNSTGQKPNATDRVKVHYRGWLIQGGCEKEFDNSYKRGQPNTFHLNQVIKGWTEGLQLVGEAGMIELEIPPKLGYGARGAGKAIPPNATLHFVVELLDIE